MNGTTYLCLLCFSLLAHEMDKVRQGIMAILRILCRAVLGVRLLVRMLRRSWCLLVVAGCSTCTTSPTRHGRHRAMLRCQTCRTHTQQFIKRAVLQSNRRNSQPYNGLLTNIIELWHQKTITTITSQTAHESIKTLLSHKQIHICNTARPIYKKLSWRIRLGYSEQISECMYQGLWTYSPMLYDNII